MRAFWLVISNRNNALKSERSKFLTWLSDAYFDLTSVPVDIAIRIFTFVRMTQDQSLVVRNLADGPQYKPGNKHHATP